MKIANRICGFTWCWFMCQNVSTVKSNFDDTEPFEQIDYSSISRNSTRCSSTELSLGKETLLHIWDIKGMLNYLVYLRRFEQIFELKTEEVSFKSENVDGKWFFKLAKIKTSSGTEMKIVATYSYEARQARKINFGINLSIINDNKEIVLPVQQSLAPVMIQQRYFNTRGYSSTLEYAYTFTWPDVLLAFENILKSRSNDLEGNVLLRFFIVAYFPKEPIYSGSETCQELSELLEVEEHNPRSVTDINKSAAPPYLRHATSMLHDDRYADIILQFGEEEILAHRIILASSSSVFSELIFNETIQQNETSKEKTGPIQVKISDRISAIGLEEMLRYIYTGKVVSIQEVADQVILAADIYGLTELKKICEAVLISNVKVDNSITMYTLGKEVHSAKLAKKAFTVMKSNKAKIVNQSDEFRTLTESYPNLMYDLFLV